jgi:hypothetical protein
MITDIDECICIRSTKPTYGDQHYEKGKRYFYTYIAFEPPLSRMFYVFRSGTIPESAGDDLDQEEFDKYFISVSDHRQKQIGKIL